MHHGLAMIAAVGGMSSINHRTHVVTQYAAAALSSLRYSDDDRPLVVLYGNHGAGGASDGRHQGPVVTFNVLRQDGTFVSPSEVVASVCVDVWERGIQTGQTVDGKRVGLLIVSHGCHSCRDWGGVGDVTLGEVLM